MSIDELDVLVGSWRITGRSKGSDRDDVSGDLHARRILGGHVLELTGTMRVGDLELPDLELVWPDEDSGGFGSHVYSTSGVPLAYSWRRAGATLIHAGQGATYTGTVSEDGTIIDGAWRPDEGQPAHPGSDYHATMHRLA